MAVSVCTFVQRNLNGIAKMGFLFLLTATTMSVTMAEDPNEFPGKGSRADWDSSATYYNRAIELGRQGKDLEACEEYKRATSIYPYKASYYYNYGRKLNKLNRLSEAIDLYKKAIQLDPEFVEGALCQGGAIGKDYDGINYSVYSTSVDSDCKNSIFNLACGRDNLHDDGGLRH